MRNRHAFSMVEVIVALLIMAALAAVIMPGVVRSMDRARVERGFEQLEGMAAGIIAFENDVNRYPSTLTMLASAPVAGDDNSCGVDLNNGQRSAWAGPYLDRLVPAPGVPVGIGTALPALVRISLGGQSANLLVVVNDVSEADALALDEMVDGDGAGAGTVQWGAIEADGFVTLTWVTPIHGC